MKKPATSVPKKKAAAPKAVVPTAARKLARLKAAKARFKRADAADDKAREALNAARKELDAALAAI